MNKNDNKNHNRNNRSIKDNNLETNFNNSRNNNISINNKREKSVGRKKYYDYKKIKWDIKKHRLKTNNKKETINYNSTANILLSNRNDKIKKKFILILLISLCYILFNLISIRNKNESNNKIIIDDILCEKTLKRLYNRTKPFEYEDELIFMIDLISCDIPFSFIRFGDGENSIMLGKELSAMDKWHWNPNNKLLRDSLIESSSICTYDNCFIGIPCKNWIKISQSILSFSKCTSSKLMSYATIFINKNYKYFKNWIIRYINSSNRRKIILIANSIINKNISWAYKFFPVPNNLVDKWDIYSLSLLPKLINLAKKNNLIFFVSAGPASNIIIYKLNKINNKNIYIDFGSSLEFITKGYSTRCYSDNGELSQRGCENFILKDKLLIYE